MLSKNGQMDSSATNVLLGGEAGQGLATVGRMLSLVLVRGGYSVVVTQSYESRIRGGHNSYAVRVAPDAIEAPAEEIDLLVALDEKTVLLHLPELSFQGIVVADESLAIADRRIVGVPFERLAQKRYANTVALGVTCSILGIEENAVMAVLEEFLGSGHPEAIEGNREALEASYSWFSENAKQRKSLPPVSSYKERIMLDGNQALALGAVSAGLRFASFYPMTPSTSISLALVEMSERMGLVVEQAEDEIAAINMALGASFAGAPSMVATSGGGFALMVEGVSLAAMTETPIVVVVAQRPGPATGLPTRTEQADLEFVLRAGHGEFPRAIFAPASVEDCFYLARKAFFLAERYQSPVFILTDQFIADSYRAVVPFDLEGLSSVIAGSSPASVPDNYRRYVITSSGVSPRLLPGASRKLVVADSDEHTEDGHLTEDLGVRKAMVEKRLRKGSGIREEVLAPEYEGSDRPELLFVSWGSTYGAVREASALLRKSGLTAATLHFNQVWPLVPEQFVERLKRAGMVVVVEGNATGQFARLLRAETGFEIPERVSRYDGLPITPQYILRSLSVEGS